MIPGSINALLLGEEAGGAAAYSISRSLRFNSSDSAYLSRTPSSAGNRKTWTWAGWVKRSGLGTYQRVFNARNPGVAADYIRFNNNDTLELYVGAALITAQVFRDLSSWYHLVVAVDTTQATSSNRVKLYVNGTQVTAFGTTNYPSQNADTLFNTTLIHNIGTGDGTTEYFSGYLADIHFIDGQALTPSSFTEVSATTGQLIPKAYTGTFGTNGFWLKFSDNSNNTATTLSKDYSSNNNNWTPVNLSPFSGTVDSAGGAKPVQNTTDVYGFIAGSGARTDSLSANLQIALPLYTSITDLSPSALATTSTTGNTALTFQTSTFKFYGGSMVSTSTGSSYGTRVNFNSTISLPSGGWTVEFFAKVINISPNGNSITVKNGSSAILDLYHYGSGNSYLIEVYFSGTSTRISGYNTASNYLDWNHYAICYNGTTATLYINGISAGTNSSNIPTQATNFELAGTGWSGNTSYITDFRIYSTAKYTGNFSIPDRTIAAGNDSLVDTPTSYGTDTGAGGEVRGNYATLNPLSAGAGATLSNGNLDLSTDNANVGQARSTIGVSSGKWYFEVVKTGGSANPMIGIVDAATPTSNFPGQSSGSYGYYGFDGKKYNNNSPASYGASYGTNDVIGVALDLDAGTLVFYKNGVSQGTAYSSLTGTFFPAVADDSGSTALTVTANFGQRPWAYAPPANHRPLVDTFLSTPGAKPNTVMDVKLYTGNGGTQTISGMGFSPDLVWIKCRSTGGTAHVLQDVVRGPTSYLVPNSTAAENTNTANDWFRAFTSDGFTVAASTTGGTPTSEWNASSSTYVAWTWDAGSSTVTNTQGSITSSVRANASSGFSVVTYTVGNNTSQTIGHGLGVAPQLIIVKERNQANNWQVYHASLGNGSFLYLNATDASGSNNLWNNTSPTSTVFSIRSGGSANFYDGKDHVAYCFAPVAGYSSGFSYTGNGSTDGSFVYLGFRPRLILLKCSSTTGNWTLLDTAREGYNVDNDPLYPNLSNAEGTTDLLDITSNGFKLRTTDASVNSSGATYVGYAWAEAPFAYSRAR